MITKDAKAAVRKFAGYIKGTIQSNNKELQQLIHGAFYRSLLIYYFTPLLGAGVVSKVQINNIESALIRKQMLLPLDISSGLLQNVCTNFMKPTAEVIGNLAYNQRLFIREGDKVEEKKLKSNINPMTPIKEGMGEE